MDKIVGVLGGGQLGRMMAEAANRLNVEIAILDKENAPAKQISTSLRHATGSFKDPESIRKLAQSCDVLTVEIEHVDVDVLREIEESPDFGAVVEPSSNTIRIIQDKYLQKLHLRERNIAVADAVEVRQNTEEGLRGIASSFGYPFMLKTRREAYDGRGNFPIMAEDDIAEAIKVLGSKGLYAEGWVAFKMELAVMVVRTASGALPYPTVETVHENSICKLVYAPARNISTAVATKAQELARKAVATFTGKGVYGVEMFLSQNDELFVNEIAPRPHNSGHYTIEACPVSQFDAHLRAILDLPIPTGSLELREPAVMLNILGGHSPEAHVEVLKEALSIPRCSPHLYGKGAGTQGRKMGHVTVTAHSMSEAVANISPLIQTVDRLSKNAGTRTAIPPPTQQSPLVAVIMGSDSDLPVLVPGLKLLRDFGIPYTQEITSAHRTPDLMADFASTAASAGIRVIIAAAGGAAHLPGMAAAHTALPVIGVPVKGSSLDGVDSLHSIVQMPRGVPVACVAIGNSLNAALLAARILGVTDLRMRRKVEEYAMNSEREVMEKGRRLRDMGWEEYLKTMPKK